MTDVVEAIVCLGRTYYAATGRRPDRALISQEEYRSLRDYLEPRATRKIEPSILDKPLHGWPEWIALYGDGFVLHVVVRNDVVPGLAYVGCAEDLPVESDPFVLYPEAPL